MLKRCQKYLCRMKLKPFGRPSWHGLNQPVSRINNGSTITRNYCVFAGNHITPRIKGLVVGQAHYQLFNDRALVVQWRLNDASTLTLVANMGNEPARIDYSCDGDVLFASDSEVDNNLRGGDLSPWAVIFYLEAAKK